MCLIPGPNLLGSSCCWWWRVIRGSFLPWDSWFLPQNTQVLLSPSATRWPPEASVLLLPHCCRGSSLTPVLSFRDWESNSSYNNAYKDLFPATARPDFEKKVKKLYNINREENINVAPTGKYPLCVCNRNIQKFPTWFCMKDMFSFCTLF